MAESESETGGGNVLEADREIAVIVNGRPKVAHQRVLTFDDVVRLAFDPVPSGPDVMFSITYSRAVKPHHEGILSEGGTVTIKPGTIFDVTQTNKS